jgi:hypothetical protein
MKRPVFILLLLLPFLFVAFIGQENYFLPIAICYIWVIQSLRLRYVGVEWRDVAIAFTPFGLKHWWKMWDKDILTEHQ